MRWQENEKKSINKITKMGYSLNRMTTSHLKRGIESGAEMSCRLSKCSSDKESVTVRNFHKIIEWIRALEHGFNSRQEQYFSLCHKVQSSSGAHQASYHIDTGCCIRGGGGVKQTATEADHSPAPSGNRTRVFQPVACQFSLTEQYRLIEHLVWLPSWEDYSLSAVWFPVLYVSGRFITYWQKPATRSYSESVISTNLHSISLITILILTSILHMSPKWSLSFRFSY
jgi:hypothetical protein